MFASAFAVPVLAVPVLAVPVLVFLLLRDRFEDLTSAGDLAMGLGKMEGEHRQGSSMGFQMGSSRCELDIVEG